MTINYTHDFTDISSCDATTSSGTHYRLNGVNSGNPLAETDAYVQGTGCIANKCGTTVSTTDTGGHFNSTATFNITGKHLFVWRLLSTAGNMLTKANAGVSIGLTNTSTTSTTAWSTTNMKRWNVDGSDTQPNSEGWKCYVIDPSGTADSSAGTLTLSTVKNVGYLCRQNTAVGTALNNVFVDAIRMGTGFTVTTTSGADVVNLAALFTYDSNKSNAWGVVTQNSGIYYGGGKITLGSTGQTNACNFTDTDQVLVWRKFPVANNLYEFKLLGASGNKTTMQWTSSVIRGQSSQPWNVTCDSNSDFKAYSCSLANLLSAVLSSGSVLSETGLTACGTVDTYGAAVSLCTFDAPIATAVRVRSVAELNQIADSSFTSAGTGHAIEILLTGTGGTYDFTLDNLTLTGYATSNGSTGNEAVYVNVPSGNTVNLIVSGGSEPKYRTAGATVNVVLGQTTVTIEANVSLAGAEVRIYDMDNNPAGSLGTELSGTESNVPTTYTYSGTAGNVIWIQIMKTGYIEFGQSYTIPASAATFTANLRSDGNS